MNMKYVIGEHCLTYKANKYREGKLKVLEDCKITLTEREREVFMKLNSPREIERCFRTIIENHWG